MVKPYKEILFLEVMCNPKKEIYFLLGILSKGLHSMINTLHLMANALQLMQNLFILTPNALYFKVKRYGI
jgi:hypothetical protein